MFFLFKRRPSRQGILFHNFGSKKYFFGPGWGSLQYENCAHYQVDRELIMNIESRECEEFPVFIDRVFDSICIYSGIVVVIFEWSFPNMEPAEPNAKRAQTLSHVIDKKTWRYFVCFALWSNRNSAQHKKSFICCNELHTNLWEAFAEEAVVQQSSILLLINQTCSF